jgi:hypothetical protein
MKNTSVRPAPGPAAAPEAIIQEARRRQRRRYAATGIAAAVALAAVLGTFAGLGGTGGPPTSRPHPGPATGHRPQVPGHIPASVGSTVLMWPGGPEQDGTIYLDNLRTGKLRRATPVVDPGEYQPIALVSGWIVYVTNDGVQAADAATGRTHLLGKALAFASSATPGDVWLEYSSNLASANASGSASASAETIRSIPVAGGTPGPPITLPRGTQLVAGTDAGLLLASSGDTGGPFSLWTPGRAAKKLPYSSSAEGFAVSPRLLAYGTDCASRTTGQNLSYGGNFGYYACRTLRVTDVRTGRLRTFAAPPGTSGWAPPHGGNWAWSGSEIAPSGQLMAAEAVKPPDSQGIARVYVLHLTGQDVPATAVPSSSSFLLSVTAWDADSSWLFYQGPREQMWAYQVTTGNLRSSTMACCQYAVMAALKTPPS